jgi:D-threo-aldose 1-dehydrogenase
MSRPSKYDRGVLESDLDVRPLGRTDVRVTVLGLGAAALGNLYAPISDEDADATVNAAFAAGIRYFDTAPYYGYGLSESRLGKGLARHSDRDVVVSSKVGRLLVPRSGAARDDQGFIAAAPFDPVFDYTYDGVMRSFESSLERLGRDRIDIALVHDIGPRTHGDSAHPRLFEQLLKGGLRALEKLRSAGAIRAIGLGVNECGVCLEALERAELDCFLLAGRYTLLEQGALEELLPACAKRGVSVIVGAPFNSGVLAEGPVAGAHYDYADVPASVLARVRGIAALCDTHGVPLPAAALQFPLRHPSVAAVIPGARSRAEVEANAAHLGHPIPDALWSDLKQAGLLAPEAPTAT